MPLTLATILLTVPVASAQEPAATRPDVPTLSIADQSQLPADVPDPSLYRGLFIEPALRTPIATALALASPFERQDPQPPPPPLPASTGIKSVFRETWHDFRAFPKRKSTWAILAIAGGTALAAHPLDDDANAKLGGSDAAGKFFAAGKYIGAVYTQAGVAVGLYVTGRYVMPHAEGASKTNKVSHLGFDMLRALAVSQALTQGIKFAVQRDRPTGECCAFPSGHASASFATAAVLERHLGYRALPTYLVASYVAMSRLHDNRHFVSDVFFGAGLGIASGWTVVGRHGRSSFALMPVPIRGGMLLTFTRDTGDRPAGD
jgi:membrane-associated phospholipid phosphatase